MSDEVKDYGAPKIEWPEPSEMRLVDAGRLLDDVERQATEANARAKRLTSRKTTAKMILKAVLEREEQDKVVFTNSQGRQVSYSPYNFDVYNIVNEDEFKAWAEEYADEGGEAFYAPALRKDIFLDEMRRRDKDGEGLPPGVQKFSDERMSRSAAIKEKPRGGPGTGA